MVKGVNKTVIEINDTGSPFFEKVVFYVSSQFGNMSAKQLENAATAFAQGLSDKDSKRRSLRKRVRLKKWVKVSLLVMGGIIVSAAAALILF